MAELIEKEKLPAHILLVTPEYKGEKLKSLATEKGLSPSAMAWDPENVHDISLNNILQVYVIAPNGSARRLTSGDLVQNAASLLSTGTYRIDPTGIDDEKIKELWWMVERGKPGVIPALVKAAKKNDQAQQLLTVVEERYQARANELQSAELSFSVFESTEAWLLEHKGLDTKELTKSFKKMAKDKSIRKELKAKSAYMQFKAMIASGKKKSVDQGTAGMKQLAVKFADTTYGKRQLSCNM